MPLIDKAKFLEYHEVDRMVLPIGARVVAPGTKPELAPGNFIKLKVDSEAASETFWAQFMKYTENDTVLCIVDNDLEFTQYHGLSFGEILEIPIKHILAYL